MNTEIIEKLRKTYAAANVHIPILEPETDRASNKDVEYKQVPFTMYETVYTYHNDNLINVEVKPITVTRYGIDRVANATAPSIDFIAEGRKATGSVNMFYLTSELAQAEVDYYLSIEKRTDAKIELETLVREHLLKMLDEIEIHLK
jgi:hypothetical protein